jgi:hypothetical protein
LSSKAWDVKLILLLIQPRHIRLSSKARKTSVFVLLYQ